jgi:hypothetical protein
MAITTAIVNVASSTSTPSGTDVDKGTSNTGAYRMDFRGKSDTTLPADSDAVTVAAYNDTAKFDIMTVSYGYLVSVQEVLLTGINALTVGIILIEDTGVTLSKAAAGALTGISVSSSTSKISVTVSRTDSELYDFVKWFESENPDEVWNNGKLAFLTTSNSINYSLATGWKLFLSNEISGGINITGDVDLESAFNLTDTTITGDLHISASPPGIDTWLKSNAERYLDAGDANGTGVEPSNGDSITSWKDLTPNGNDAALTGVTYNTTEKALDVGSTDGVTFTGALSSGAKSIFFVLQKRSGLDVDGRGVQGTSGNVLIGHWNSYGDALYIDGDPAKHNATPADLTKNTLKRIYNLEYLSSSSLKWWQAGNNLLTDTSVNDLTIALAINAGGQNDAEGVDMWLQTFIVINGTLTTSERQDIEGYLAWKHGRESDLPSGHPYENSAPAGGVEGSDSTLTFDNVTVTGNVYNDDALHTLTINATNGSSLVAGDSGTGDGETNILNSVNVKIIVKDASTLAAVQGAMVLVKEDPSGTDLIKTTTDVNGEVSAIFNYSTDQDITGVVRKGTSVIRYKQSTIAGSITSTGFETTVFLVSDE